MNTNSNNNSYKQFIDIDDEIYRNSKLGLERQITKQNQKEDQKKIIKNSGQSYMKRLKNMFVRDRNIDRFIDFEGNVSANFGIDNSDKNTKYNLITFLPVVLYNQFKFFFNFLYLCVATTQFIPQLQIGYFISYVGPLVFVLMLSLFKELIDDLQRYMKDYQINNKKYKVLRKKKGLVEIKSKNIRVGDIVEINSNQRVPADLVVVCTDEISGNVFIRTDQLDGETDWKVRTAIKHTQKVYNHALSTNTTEQALLQHLLHNQYKVVVPPASTYIYSFTGQFQQPSTTHSPKTPLSLDNTIWANSILTNSRAYGLVIYIGEETRTRMNSNKARCKFGYFDQEVNTFSKVLFMLSACLSIFMICLKGFDPQYTWVVTCFRYFLIMTSLIPISVRVHLDVSKSIFCYFISNDSAIPETAARNSNIPEELGRISFLLTDKTGTLTQNDMVLKRLSTSDRSYSVDEDGRELKKILNTYNKGMSMSNIHSNSVMSSHQEYPVVTKRDLGARLNELMIALSLCNTVKIEETKREEIDSSTQTWQYQASSPDEYALVMFGQEMLYELFYRKDEEVKVNILGQSTLYDELAYMPFNSDIKRMGLLVRHRQTSKITFYLKGADNVMVGLLKKVYIGQVQDEADSMAREGLRTLVFAQKQMTGEGYIRFKEQYDRASVAMQDRQAMLERVWKTLEIDMELLGITGVEDKLQLGVCDTIETIRNAGIRVWMLTGDKVETAKCIATAAGIKGQNEDIFQIMNESDPLHLHNLLIEFSNKLHDHVLLVDGSSLAYFIDEHDKLFFNIATQSKSVIFTRCSPLQKASIAQKVKEYSRLRVLCIGDGGNDVGMIQVGDVGVGIYGKEGQQAALASDFTVTQFQFLRELLLWHGRQAYKRSAHMVHFIFQRGQLISFIQMFFMMIFYMNSIPCYNGTLMMMYSTVYTALPVFSFIIDQDVSPQKALAYPLLYKTIQKSRDFATKQYFKWLFITIYQAFVILYFSIYVFENMFINFVTISFSALIFSEYFNLFLVINTFKYQMSITIMISTLVYIVSITQFSNIVHTQEFIGKQFWINMASLVFISCFPFYLMDVLTKYLSPSEEQRIMMKK